MRIGHYAPDIWTPGGIASYIRRLGAAQSARGHEVWYLDRRADAASPADDRHVIVDGDRALDDNARRLNLDVLHLHKPTDELPAADLPCVRTMHGNQGACPSGSRFLSRTQTPCDRAYSLSGCLWGHVVDGCGSRHPRALTGNIRRFHHERRLAARMPTMTVSTFLRDQMVRAGCPAHRLEVVASPAPVVDTPAVPMQREGTPRLLFLGRVVPQKGLAWLLRALAQIEVPLHLDVAGDGRALDDMRRLADTLGVADRVTFHGWVDPAHVPPLIEAARAVVVPSLWHEPAGLTTLEAAAHARPVVASTVGGIPEYAHPDFAVLVPPNDIDALAAALTPLATDPDRAETMGLRGRVHARHTFAMDTFLDRVEAVYETVLDTPAPASVSPLP